MVQHSQRSRVIDTWPRVFMPATCSEEPRVGRWLAWRSWRSSGPRMCTGRVRLSFICGACSFKPRIVWNNAGKRLATQPAPVYEPEAVGSRCTPSQPSLTETSQVFTRDGRRCVLTGNARPSLDELERKWGPIRFITAAPILPAYLPDFRKTKLFGFKVRLGIQRSSWLSRTLCARAASFRRHP